MTAVFNTDPTRSQCSCAHHGVTLIDELARKIAQGMDQMTASRLLWGPKKEDA